MENKQDIGQAFRDKLGGLHREPGHAVWEGINATLRQQKRGGFRMPFWGRATAIALGVIVTLVLTHPLYKGYLPEIIIKMPGDKEQTVSKTGNGTGTAMPQGNSTTPASQNSQNSTGTAGTPRSQEATDATANAAAVNANNTGTATVNNSTPGNQASGKTGTGIASASGTTTDAATANTKAPRNGKSAKTSGNAKQPYTAHDNNAGHTKGNASKSNTISGKALETNNIAVNKNSNKAKSGTGKGSTAIAAKGNTPKGDTATRPGSSAANSAATLGSVPATAANGATNTGIAATAQGTGTPDKNNIAAQTQGNTAVTGVNTPKDATAKAGKDQDGSLLYSTGNFPTITKSVADSLLLAQKAFDEAAGKERTFAKNNYTPLQDSLGGGNGYTSSFYAFAYVAPSNYKFGEGTSLIDPSLNSHGTSAETSTNFGIYAGYEFTSQFSIRAGISGTKITQNTGNVTLGANYQGVDYANGTSNTTANVALGGNPVTLQQKTTFIEVPVEATYALFGTRADLYFKGGFSTLYLQDNELHAQNGQGSVLLGSLNTAKDFSISGNLGFGFYYKFTRELQLNIEPGVKYYFNTFDNVSPWSLSVQAGLLYRF